MLNGGDMLLGTPETVAPLLIGHRRVFVTEIIRESGKPDLIERIVTYDNAAVIEAHDGTWTAFFATWTAFSSRPLSESSDAPMNNERQMRAPSTFAQDRRRMPWSKLWADQWRQIESSGISDGAKLLWVSLQSVLVQSEEPGRLVMSGNPMDTRALSLLLGKKERNIATWLAQLTLIGAMCQDCDGNLYDPRMREDHRATSYETNRKRERKAVGNESGIPTDSRDIKNKSKIEDKEQEEEQEKEKGASRKHSLPLSESEIAEYTKQQGLPDSDACYLWNHWQANRFTNNGKPILNWKATIRSWKAAGILPKQPNGVSAALKPKPQEPDGWRDTLRKLYPNERDLQVAVVGIEIPPRFKLLPESVQREIREHNKAECPT